jgi:hypothetical protein
MRSRTIDKHASCDRFTDAPKHRVPHQGRQCAYDRSMRGGKSAQRTSTRSSIVAVLRQTMRTATVVLSETLSLNASEELDKGTWRRLACGKSLSKRSVSFASCSVVAAAMYPQPFGHEPIDHIAVLPRSSTDDVGADRENRLKTASSQYVPSRTQPHAGTPCEHRSLPCARAAARWHWNSVAPFR